ncbi:MAG TPA: response regulator [Polyangiaceae bacterium]|jgi:FixJ family two-component response regulator|nr:response regulator [Polyangiaceae bacterium]
MASDSAVDLAQKDQLRRTLTVLPRVRVAIVDDDESCREAVQELLRANDFDVQMFASAEALLASSDWLECDCMLVDATLPGASGPELQRLLGARNIWKPVVFVTGYDDAGLRASVIAAGAIECLYKPYEEDELLSSLQKAMAAGAAASSRAVP